MKRAFTCLLILSVVLPLMADTNNTNSDASNEVSKIEGDSSDPERLFLLGRKYLMGDGVDKDPAKALELMLEAAKQGYGPALGGVGYFYSIGLTVELDDTEAVMWFRQGAEKGDARAQYNLAQMLLVGRGGDKNEAEGLQWLEKAATQDMVDAVFALGEAHFLAKFGLPNNAEKAFPLYLKAAKLGNVKAQNSVGVMYRFGQGTKTDLALAKDWFLKAANQDDARAQSNLGQMYRIGEGFDRDLIEAVFWLKLSTRQGDVTAARLLEGILVAMPADDVRAANQKVSEWTTKRASAPANP